MTAHKRRQGVETGAACAIHSRANWGAPQARESTVGAARGDDARQRRLDHQELGEVETAQPSRTAQSYANVLKTPVRASAVRIGSLDGRK